MTNIYIFPFVSQKEAIKQHLLMLPAKNDNVTLCGWNDKQQLIYYNSKSIAYGNFDDCNKFIMTKEIRGIDCAFLYADTQEALDDIMYYATFHVDNWQVRMNNTQLEARIN